MELNGKHILVVGLGRTGVAVSRFLSARGALVTISDAAPEGTQGDVIPEMRQLAASMEFGEHRLETFTSADAIVLSPGVPHTIPVIQAAREKGIPVIGELELSFRFIQEPMIAVTGTNGKTTTTELLGHMLEASGLRVFVGGNIGNPLIEYLAQNNPVDTLVAEVSSFQLDTADTFRPGSASCSTSPRTTWTGIRTCLPMRLQRPGCSVDRVPAIPRCSTDPIDAYGASRSGYPAVNWFTTELPTCFHPVPKGRP